RPPVGRGEAGEGAPARGPAARGAGEEGRAGQARTKWGPSVNMIEPHHVPIERFTLRAVGRTDVGAQRTQNEDAMYFDDFLGNYVVCDGMGGHASGQVASDVAIRTIIHALKTGDPPPAPGMDPMVAAMRAANAAVFQRAQMDPACHGMGTTAVGLRAEE